MECRGHFSVDYDHSPTLAAPRIQIMAKISLKNEIFLPHKVDVLHFVNAKKPLLNLNTSCMYINVFLSASFMQGFVQDAAV